MNAKWSNQMKVQEGNAAAVLAGNLLQRKCACGQHTMAGGECEACDKKRLQRRATGQAETTEVPPIVHEVLRSPGQPMEASTRALMEPRFNQDFSRVRVHTDTEAAESARAVNSLAYTAGRDVVFGARQYAPGTSAGQQLLAHELAHVVQQSGRSNSSSSNLVLGEFDSAHEREAESVSARLSDAPAVDSAGARTGGLTNTQPGVVQRLGPLAAAGIGAAAGAAAATISFKVALDYGKSLATRFPGWLSVLPNCPCQEKDVLADKATWGKDANPVLSYFHPGAETSYRSNSTFTTVPGSAHGQQCTYDKGGNLLTEGPGAGTPDSWSPVTNSTDHMTNDALTWQVLGWRIYTRYWQPNNGKGCKANRGENTLGRRFSEFMP